MIKKFKTNEMLIGLFSIVKKNKLNYTLKYNCYMVSKCKLYYLAVESYTIITIGTKTHNNGNILLHTMNHVYKAYVIFGTYNNGGILINVHKLSIICTIYK